MKQKEKKTKEKRLTLEQRLALLPKFENKSLTQTERELEVCARQVFRFMVEKLGITQTRHTINNYVQRLIEAMAFNDTALVNKGKLGYFISYSAWEKNRYSLYKNSYKNYFRLLDKNSYFSLLDKFFTHHLREFYVIEQNKNKKIERYNELIKIMETPVDKKEPLYIFYRVTKVSGKTMSIAYYLKRHYNINLALLKEHILYENYLFGEINFIKTSHSLVNEKHLRAFVEFLNLLKEIYPARSFRAGELSTILKVAQSNIFDFLKDKEAYEKKYNVLYVKGKKYRQTANMV